MSLEQARDRLVGQVDELNVINKICRPTSLNCNASSRPFLIVSQIHITVMVITLVVIILKVNTAQKAPRPLKRKMKVLEKRVTGKVQRRRLTMMMRILPHHEVVKHHHASRQFMMHQHQLVRVRKGNSPPDSRVRRQSSPSPDLGRDCFPLRLARETSTPYERQGDRRRRPPRVR